MKAQLTFYAKPEDREKVANDLKSLTSKDIQLFPQDMKYLSWTAETEVEVSDQQDAFRLERELQQINKLIDVEVDIEDSPQEAELNYRFPQLNESINEGKSRYPHPYWYHHSIQLNEALEYAQKNFENGNGSFDLNESRMNIAMLDTGYTNHPEIAGIDKSKWRNFMPREDPNDPLDTLESTRPLPIRWGGHGTSCSGVIMGSQTKIAQEHRIPQEQVYFEDLVEGLLPNNINLIHYRISKSIISFTNRMADAIRAVVEDGTIPVISMSHASLLNKRIYRAATREAYEKGIILVAAPGSHVFGSKKVFTYPAKYSETIAVAASTSQNIPWRLTHGGPEVDLCAPGFEMYIPFPYEDRDFQNRGYGYKWSEGSSFSVPITATAAALWRMYHGETLKQFSPIEQVELFRSIIKKTATPFAGPVEPGIYGAGVINFRKMLEHSLAPSRALSMKSAATAALAPEMMFQVDKETASYQRELCHLKSLQFVNNQSKAIPEMDFYFENGTAQLQQWMEKKTKRNKDKLAKVRTYINSYL
jgi:subtilisin family serine protease